ncbi:MAG: 16S rRNA processing protein RimM [Alistipes sp.]|uniref:ribosome maturation factor RimM n=1 Tax=Alistipes sp. TaxID=1872444 RepID=UPI0025C440D6|nr:16S rRNA processing protein RimM [Alistipes sp.]MCD8273919.1 16S rRNA processing protein RimM [Alistipes sp.]
MSVSIPAGRINRLFGTDGGVMLSLYADFPADFDTDTPLLVTIDALEVPLWCERFERRGASGAVAAFADFDTERRAQELLGLEFRIRFDEEDDDEFYMEDLIGFAVTGFEMRHGGTENSGSNSDNSDNSGSNGSNGSGNSGGNDDTCNDDGSRGSSNGNANSDAGDGTPPAGQFAGRVADYYDSEANPLFELEIGGRRVLVPAAEEFIAHIDFEGRTMKMILPEGLIDL